MLRNGNVEALITIVAATPHTCFSVVNVDFSQFLIAFRANIPVSLTEVCFQIHVAAFYMLNKRAFLDVERFAKRAAVTEGNVG